MATQQQQLQQHPFILPNGQDARCLAASRGDLLALQRGLDEEGWWWDVDVAAAAAMAGKLHTLQWLRERGCPWDSWTCDVALAMSHMDVFAWAKANGCPWEQPLCTRVCGM
jgi:hypothetical protein